MIIATEHVFLDCQFTLNFAVEIERWIQNFANKLDNIHKKFGDQYSNQDINLIVIMAKRTIYKSRLHVRGSLYTESRIFKSNGKIVSIHLKTYFNSGQWRKFAKNPKHVIKNDR